MARNGFDTTKPVFIWDGNSLIQQGYDNNRFTDALTAEYGAGNYVSYKVAVGGQNVDDMQGRVIANVLPLLNRNLSVYYINQPGRNQIKQTADSNATILTKIQTLYQTVKDSVSNTKTVAILTSASVLGSGDYTVMTDIPILNGLISGESAGDIDNKYDLYNNGNGFDSGANKPPFQADEVHYSVPTGQTTHANNLVAYVASI